MANDALNVNRPTAPIDITTHGSDWLWAVFSLFLLTDLIFVFWTAFVLRRGQRVFHHIALVILTVGSIAYFSMASDLGSTPILVEFSRITPGVAGSARAIWVCLFILFFISFVSS